jgi:DNA-binding NarL/FixJ family response regulator
MGFGSSESRPASRGGEIQTRLQHLKQETERLRLEFLRSELEISYTMATFGDARRDSARLIETSRRAGTQGYTTALRILADSPFFHADPEIETGLDRLRSALGGATVPSPPVPHSEPDVPRDSRLTRREIEVLRHIAEGRSTKETAHILGMTFKTAACHRYRLMDKLGIHETANLVRYAIRNGLVQL